MPQAPTNSAPVNFDALNLAPSSAAAPITPTATATNAPVQMTRAEYQAKYGAPPPVTTQSAPVQMTHAQYMAKYGTAAPTTPSPDLLDKLSGVASSITDFLGLHNAVDTTATNLAGIGLATKGLATGKIDTANAQIKDLGTPSLKEDIGAGTQIGAATAGLAAGQPESLAGSAALFGGLGAAQAGGEAAAGNADLATVAKKAFFGGLAGTAIGAVGYGIQKGVEAVTSKAPDALYNTALNVSKKVTAAGKSPADFLANEGVWGTLGSISHQVEDGMATENAAIADKVAQTEGTVSFADIKQQAVDSLANKFGNLYSKSELEGLVDSVPIAALKTDEGVDYATANQTRQQLGRLIGDSKWLQSNPTQNTSAAQAVYRALAKNIQDTTDTSQEFSRLSQYIEANKAVKNALLSADKKWVPGFYDWTSGAVGSVAGLFGGNPMAGAAGAIALQRATRSPLVQTAIAQGINAIPEVGGSLGRAAATSFAGGAIGNTQ